MNSNPIKTLGSITCLLLALELSARAAEGYSRAEITRVDKDVKVLKANVAPKSAIAGQQIGPQTSVATGAASRAELRFPDKTLTRLGANSRFTLRGESRTIDLDEGVMMLQVPKNQGGAKIRTAGVTAAVTGTTVLIEYHPGGVVKLFVLEGEATISINGKPGEFQTLKAGQMVTFTDGAPSIPLPIDFDLKAMLESSTLISANDASQPNLQEIIAARGVQQQKLLDGDLLLGNFSIPSTGFTVGQSNNVIQNNVIMAQPPAPSPPVEPHHMYQITEGEGGGGCIIPQ